MPKGPKVYVTLEKRYTTQALKVLRFVPDGSQMVKRACAASRSLLQAASMVFGGVLRPSIAVGDIELKVFAFNALSSP